MQKRNEKKDFKEGLLWSRKNKNWRYPWKSSSLHLINHWKLTLNSPFKYHYNVKFSKFTKCFLCIYIRLFLDYKIFWGSNTHPPFSCLPLKKVVGGKCFTSVCWSFSLFVGWLVCTVSVAWSMSFYSLPERYLISTMVSSGEWMIPRVWSHVFKGQCQTVIPHSKCCQLNISTSILCLILTKLGTVFAPRE